MSVAEMIGSGIGVGIVAFLLWTLYRAVVDATRDMKEWKKVAERTGLEYGEEDWGWGQSMEGQVRDRRTEIAMNFEKNPRFFRLKKRRFVTRIRMELKHDCWSHIGISKHGVADSLAVRVGGDDIEIGDEAFDSEFRIVGRLDDRGRRHMRSEPVQSTFWDLVDEMYEVEIEEGMLRVAREERYSRAGNLESFIERVVEAADELDGIESGGWSPGERGGSGAGAGGETDRENRQAEESREPSVTW